MKLEKEESEWLPELRVPCWYGPGALECVHLCHNLELATESSYNVEIYYNCIVIGWWCVNSSSGDGDDDSDGDGDGDGGDAPQSPALLSDIRV